jgi:hypothetical protein
MLTLILIGCIALLINTVIYIKELQLIAHSVKQAFRREGPVSNIGKSIWMFVQDALVTGFVILLAGTGLYSFIIGTVGGCLVSAYVWREQIKDYFENKLSLSAPVRQEAYILIQ